MLLKLAEDIKFLYTVLVYIFVVKDQIGHTCTTNEKNNSLHYDFIHPSM